jgi:hypothetical protein
MKRASKQDRSDMALRKQIGELTNQLAEVERRFKNEMRRTASQLEVIQAIRTIARSIRSCASTQHVDAWVTVLKLVEHELESRDPS